MILSRVEYLKLLFTVVRAKILGCGACFFLRGMTPHGCDTRGDKRQTGGIPSVKNAFGVTFLV